MWAQKERWNYSHIQVAASEHTLEKPSLKSENLIYFMSKRAAEAIHTKIKCAVAVIAIRFARFFFLSFISSRIPSVPTTVVYSIVYMKGPRQKKEFWTKLRREKEVKERERLISTWIICRKNYFFSVHTHQQLKVGEVKPRRKCCGFLWHCADIIFIDVISTRSWWLMVTTCRLVGS